MLRPRPSSAVRELLDTLARWRSHPLRGYGGSLVIFAVALVSRQLMSPVLPPTGFPFLTFFPAVILTALVGGLGPSLLVSLLSALAADYFFMAPVGSLRLAGPTEVVALGFFVAVLLVDCLVIHTMLTALQEVRAQQERNAALNEELARRLKELDASRSAIERVSRAKSRILAIVGHDLRQPLHVISGAVRLLLQRNDSEAARPLLRMTERNILSIAHSFDQLLNVARHESVNFQPQLGPFPLGPLLEQLRDEYSPLALERGLSLEIAPCPHEVVSDAALLLSILRNLLGNALKYTPRGGSVRLEARLHQERWVRVEVADTGPGIPPDKQALIFQEFQRLDPSRADGVGLGLALTKKNAELLGLPLGLESEVGKGSRFAVDVPLAPASPE